MEEKQKLFKMLRSMNLGGESGLEPFTPPGTAIDVFTTPEIRGEFGAGLLDLHAMDDNELLSEVSKGIFVFLSFRHGIWSQ
jgi:kinesin family protein 2/24